MLLFYNLCRGLTTTFGISLLVNKKPNVAATPIPSTMHIWLFSLPNLLKRLSKRGRRGFPYYLI